MSSPFSELFNNFEGVFLSVFNLHHNDKGQKAETEFRLEKRPRGWYISLRRSGQQGPVGPALESPVGPGRKGQSVRAEKASRSGQKRPGGPSLERPVGDGAGRPVALPFRANLIVQKRASSATPVN